MGGNRQLAAWLAAHRREIEARLATRLGRALPAPESPEQEALRRFRSFSMAALLHGSAASPALDGLRVDPRRCSQLLDTWLEAAGEAAGQGRDTIQQALEPLLARFRAGLRVTHNARRQSGAPRTSRRRAVSAAIDRVADAFLAIETDTARIADANPAAGALLGTSRDTLLGASALGYVPEPSRDLWWVQLDAMAEGGEPVRFQTTLIDASGRDVAVDARVTRFATRARTLALVLARPLS